MKLTDDRLAFVLDDYVNERQSIFVARQRLLALGLHLLDAEWLLIMYAPDSRR